MSDTTQGAGGATWKTQRPSQTRAQRFGDDHHTQLANGASLERFNRLRGEADRSARQGQKPVRKAPVWIRCFSPKRPGTCQESAGVMPVLLSLQSLPGPA
jgi:hypothetical protein